MRLVQLLLDDEHADPALSILEDEQIDYVLFEAKTADEAGEQELLVEFPLPDQAVEYIRDRFDEAGIDQRYVITLNAESAETDRFGDLEDRFVTGTEAGDSISPGELRATVLSLHPDPLPYYLMTVISALVAVAGLLVDSAALVVGAMVIAPQVGSALTASVGAAIADWKLLKRGVRAQIVSLSLAILAAAAFGVVLQSSGFVSPVVDVETIAQVGERTAPGLLTLAVGLAAGIAGAVGLATALPVSIVGVMIAAALIPAAAAVGIGIAWNNPGVAIGAGALLVANLVSVNVAGLLTLRGFGYRSTDTETPRSSPSKLGPALLAVALVGAVLASGGLFTAQASFENEVNSAVGDVLDDEAYEDLELVQTRVEFVVVPGSAPPEIRVIVQRPTAEQTPTLATDLGRAIQARTGRVVTVQVEFVGVQRYNAEG